MNSDNSPGGSSNLILQLAQLLITSLASKRFFRFVRSLLRPRNRGLYEILDYNLTLDIADSKGRLAIFRRRQKVRFLQDHVIAYQDEAWGDGDVLADYECSPGVAVDNFQVGARRMILISLRQTKNRGDVLDFDIKRTVKNGFANNEEWLEVETRYPTRRLRISVIFPSGRHCKAARLIERRAERTTPLSARCFSLSRNGRQTVTWECKRPAHLESYTLCWSW